MNATPPANGHTSLPPLELHQGRVRLDPRLEQGHLHSLGAVTIDGVPLRGATRFLPWFDSYDGEVFNRFRFLGCVQEGARTRLRTLALSDADYPFREMRDSSGDVCFRETNWDRPPLEAEFDILIEPAADTIDGRDFIGFTYWFEGHSPQAPIHRLLDRQTWELGGNLDDVTLVIRNWLTRPVCRILPETHYSSAGIGKHSGLYPGNLWARWTVLPGYDLQYGARGVLVGRFDRVSLIRTVIESMPDEPCIRHMDLHAFEQTHRFATNPKTILFSPQPADDIDILNLWTRLHDRERDRACAQFGIPEEGPPQITVFKNQWVGFRYKSSYEDVLGVAAEVGADNVFVDPPWEHYQAWEETLNELVPKAQRRGTILDKQSIQNMCCTFDFEVAKVLGGEAELKALCDRARARGLRVVSWIAGHYSGRSFMVHDPLKLGHGAMGVIAAKESGRHPDTGYAADCWPINLNAPVGDHVLQQILGVCQRTGLAGFLWDSHSNLGWWQLDYSKGDLRPQFDKQARWYAEMVKAGLYLMPESIATFSRHSCLSMFAGNVYDPPFDGYAYESTIAINYTSVGGHPHDQAMLRGLIPTTDLFRCIAHKRVPNNELWQVPRDQWNPSALAAIKAIFAAYKTVREDMHTRTVLKADAGVAYVSRDRARHVLFSFKDQSWQHPLTDVLSGESTTHLRAEHVYRGGA